MTDGQPVSLDLSIKKNNNNFKISALGNQSRASLWHFSPTFLLELGKKTVLLVKFC